MHVFIEALFIIDETWKQPRYPSLNKWILNYDALMKWNIISDEKK